MLSVLSSCKEGSKDANCLPVEINWRIPGKDGLFQSPWAPPWKAILVATERAQKTLTSLNWIWTFKNRLVMHQTWSCFTDSTACVQDRNLCLQGDPRTTQLPSTELIERWPWGPFRKGESYKKENQASRGPVAWLPYMHWFEANQSISSKSEFPLTPNPWDFAPNSGSRRQIWALLLSPCQLTSQ